MCDPVTMTLAAVSAGSQVGQARGAKSQAYAEAGQMDYQAALDRDNAALEAGMIRRAGERERGQTLAGIVASGVKIGEGSALDAEREVMENAAEDEYLTILQGERSARALELSARQRRAAGRAAKRAGYIGAATSLLSAGANGFGSFKGWDAGGFNGTNDRGPFGVGSAPDWHTRNGRGGD